jgi:hypothetical protein
MLCPAFFFLSDTSLLSNGLGQCSGVPPNLSQRNDTIWRLLFQKKNAGYVVSFQQKGGSMESSEGNRVGAAWQCQASRKERNKARPGIPKVTPAHHVSPPPQRTRNAARSGSAQRRFCTVHPTPFLSNSPPPLFPVRTSAACCPVGSARGAAASPSGSCAGAFFPMPSTGCRMCGLTLG